MKKTALKFGAPLAALTIIVAAVISANTAQADSSSSSSSPPAWAAQAAQSFMQFLKDNFVTLSEDYVNYLSGTLMPSNQTSVTGDKFVPPASANDTANYLATNSLYVPNALSVQQQYYTMIPTSQSQVSAQVPNFNSATLLNTLTLTDTAKPQAQSFIDFVSDVGDPVQTPPASLAANHTVAVMTYFNQLGAYNAQLSNGINVFYNFYEERLPQSQLNGKSILENDATNAARRMQKDWYTQITSPDFTPVNVARENLTIQAENRYELFQIRMQLEQLNATMATLQLQLLQAMSKPALIAAENQAKKSVSGSS